MIAAALSIQDPRERPTDRQQAADTLARPVRRPDLRFPRDAASLALPGRAAGGTLLQQLPPDVRGGVPALPAGARVAGPGHAAARRRARARHPGPTGPRRHRRGRPRTRCTRPCSPGCSRISGCARESAASTQGARGSRFTIFPGSALAKQPPRWVMAAELVETSRLFARVVARIEPDWVEPLAGHLVDPYVQRAALGEAPRPGDGVRTGHALRAADRHRPQGRVRRASIRRCHASSSSATRWWRVIGARITRSSRPTNGCARRSASSRNAPGAAISSSTTRPSSISTTSASAPRWCPAGTSTAGGSGPGGATRSCSP